MANKIVLVVSSMNAIVLKQNEFRKKIFEESRKSESDECDKIETMIL